MSSQDGALCIWLLWRTNSRGPRVWVLSGFDLTVERLGKNNEIFLSRIFKIYEKLAKRKFGEGRVGLGALIKIKLNNVLEANIDCIEGKTEGRSQVEEHEYVCFLETCKKAIKFK